MSTAVSSYPPMPWTLRPRGICLAAAYLVPVDRVRAHVPKELSIVAFLPGFTGGALFLADYGPGSDLQYSELIVVTAAVRHEGRIAWHVAEILVDGAASFEGGRTLLGVPKRMAEFRRSPGVVEVFRDGEPYLTWRYARPWWLLRGRVYVEAANAGVDDGRLRVCGNRIEAVAGFVRSEVALDGGPARTVFPDRPLFTVAGKDCKALLGQPIC